MIIKEALDYVSKIVGLDTNYSRIRNTSEIEEIIDSDLDEYKNITELLSYRYYDEKNKIFINEGNNLSMMIELSPIVGVTENITKNLEQFFNNDMLEKSHAEFLLIASNYISDNLNFWLSNKHISKSIQGKFFHKRSEYLNQKSKNFDNNDFIFPRNFRLFLSYSIGGKNNNITKEKLSFFIGNLTKKLESMGIDSRICSVNDLISLVNEILEVDFKNSAEKEFKYDPQIPISSQVLKSGALYSVNQDAIKNNKTNVTSRIYYPSDFPREFSLAHMLKLLGDGDRDYLSIPARFIISYVVSNNINNAQKSSLIQKGSRIIDSSEEWYSRNNRNIKREAMEWKDVNDRAKNGENFLTESFQLMISAQDDLIEKAQQNLFSLYQIYDWKIVQNKYFQLPSMISILPMQSIMMWQYLEYFKLTRIVLAKEVTSKLPIHGEWKGVPEAGMLLLGRRGQLFNWNPYFRLSSGNYNICIFGPSGSGKSVFLQELSMNMISQNTKIFILDIGRSFQNICQLLGGEIIEFGNDSRIILNPFSEFKNIKSQDDRNIAISYAKNIICVMSGASGDPIKESIIEKSIIYGLKKYSDSLDLSKLSIILSDQFDGKVSSDLAMSLFSYTKEGLYGDFFDPEKSRKEASFNKDMTIFEFEEIKNNTLLLSVVLQIIGMQIFMQILTGDRSRKFMLIVDEAWMILDHSAKFLSELARTIRKYGGSLVVCVQNYNDLTKGDYQNAILQNSSWTILLKQDEKGISSFKESDAFKDIVHLIKSLSISRDKYAEMLIYATNLKVVGRLVLDPFSKILFSTDSEIFAQIKTYLSDNIELEKVIEKIAKERYPEKDGIR